MTQKSGGRTDGHQETPKTSNRSFLGALVSWLKSLIITLAVWGWFPFRLADWITRQGGHHED